jgi:hypothetical protein
MLSEELHTYLFDGRPHLLSESIREWLQSSRRFTTFASASREKIRKKLRVTRDEETLFDLRLELETAYLLLREKALDLAYEAEHNRPGRSPDFAVTFTTSLTFMVEVTRLRNVQMDNPDLQNTLPGSAASERLTDAVCSKLDQLLPSRSNILIVGMDGPRPTQGELKSLMLRLQQRAERNDPSFWQRYRFRDRADFFNRYLRLSEILVRPTELQGHASIVAWSNPTAKHPLPGKVRTALYRSHTF